MSNLYKIKLLSEIEKCFDLCAVLIKGNIRNWFKKRFQRLMVLKTETKKRYTFSRYGNRSPTYLRKALIIGRICLILQRTIIVNE